MNQLKKDIYELKVWVREMFFLYKMKIRLQMATKMADMKHVITNKQYLVIADKSSGLMVICPDQIQGYKKAGRIKKGYNFLDIERITFYQTPVHRGGEGLSIKKRLEMAKRYRQYIKLISPFKPMVGTPGRRVK